MRGHCGLLDEANACRCHRRVGTAIRTGTRATRTTCCSRAASAMVYGEWTGSTTRQPIFRSHPELRSPDRVVEVIQRLMRDA